MLELDKILQLKDGRKLGYGEYGSPDGKPLLFFHGTPGSRKMRHPDHGIAEHMGARIITIDRPGFGLSDPLPKRTLLDWPVDVLQLADQLQIARFAVIGFSGGGPHAAACAYRCADRVSAISLVSSVGPPGTMNRPASLPFPLGLLFRGAHQSPAGLATVTNLIFPVLKLRFDFLYDRAAARLPDSDREILLQPEIREIFRESIAEAFRQGTKAFQTELRLHVQDWGFSLKDIRVPVFLWHGTNDSFHNGKLLSDSFLECRSTFLQEGHLVLFRHWEEILHQLLRAS